MAHEIDMTTGRAACAYLETAGTPWHGLGTPMTLEDDHDAWKVGACMDWRIVRADVRYTDTNNIPRVMRDRSVLIRSDTGMALSVVSDRYQITQPETCLEMFRETADSQGWQLETAGVLREGRQFWALARTPLGDDETSLYTLMSTSADGSLATSVTGTAVRVACANTLAQALRGDKRREIRIRHNTAFDVAQIRAEFDMVDLDATWGEYSTLMMELRSLPVSTAESLAIFSELLRPGSIEAAKTFATAPQRAIRGLEALVGSYLSAPGACPGTGYGVLQGVTHYLDHVRGTDADRRSSAWFGQGAALKDSAIELIRDESVWRGARV